MSPRTSRPWRALVTTLGVGTLSLATLAAPAAIAQGNVTSPKSFLGHNIGDDYFLPTYDQFIDYWKKIDGESNRMQVMEIGKTGEGRPHLAAIITAPENFSKLARYKEISKRLQSARGLTDDQARLLAKEGKSVVWIDGGLHATEVVGANQLMETSYQLVSRTDEETMRILKDVIVVMVHANPDGMQMVAKCYMQEPVPEKRRGPCSTRLYEKYAGHDNNRDFYMSNLPESQNMNKLMYWEWMPQIMYNHHQTGPAGTVIFSPPFRDPFNYNFDPMIVMGLDMVGAAMHQRFLQENKPGFTMRSGSSYSTWWNGGLRTTAYFQNIIGILTEIIGSPTPSNIPITLSQTLPRGDLPAPIAPQEWHMRQSIDYSVTANYSILDLASRYKDQFLFNIYRMGANQIARGSTDHWTITNKDMERADSAMRGPATTAAGRGGRAGGAPVVGGDAGADFAGFGRGPQMTQAQYNAVFKDPAHRDPRAFVVPVNQPDFSTATKFINTMRYVGVEVQQATAPFTVNGKNYGAGSYVIHSAQAGRAHVIDMFEPQDHPNDMDERGIPRRPYDNAGWTLAYQMGVQFDRFFEDVKGPFEDIKGLATPLAGTVASASGASGFLISGSVNDAFTVANRVLKAGGEVFRLTKPMTANGKTFGPGAFYVTASSAVSTSLQSAAKELGVSMEGTTAKPDANSTKLSTKRVALWDTQTGSMSSGWTRFLLERFEFPFKVVCGAGFDDTDLKGKYDVIVLPSDGNIGGGGGRGGAGGGGGGGRGGDAAATTAPPTDPDLRSLCEVTTGTGTGATTLANIKKFVEAGGILVAAGNASRIGQQLGLPVTDYLVEKAPNETDVHLASDKFYVPGSVLRLATDSTASSALGMQGHTDMFFNNNPVFRLDPTAAAKGVRPTAWFDSATPLRSGWAWGQNYLTGGTAAFEAPLGRGKLFMFGPEITFRGQPHASFKMLFNSIYNVDQTPKITP